MLFVPQWYTSHKPPTAPKIPFQDKGTPVTAGDPKKLAALIKKLRAAHGGTPPTPPDLTPDAPDGFDDLLHQLIFSMMLWEATTAQALGAVKRLREHFADANEVRVCMADDTVQCLGERYPLARERALRLRHALHDVFQRHQVLSLTPLHTLPRKDATAFLESLDGMPFFVAQRVSVVCLDAHVCPVDSKMRDCLARDRIVPEDMPATEASRFISHHIKPEDAITTYLLLQDWADERADTKRTKANRSDPGDDTTPRSRKRKTIKPTPQRKPKGTKQ